MTPARLLAPAALVAAAIALFAVVSSGSDTSDRSDAPDATSTPATPSKQKANAKAKATPTAETSGRTYTVKPGDSPYSIAQDTGIDMDELLAANPDADASALRVGQKLKLP
jgi:LysM repeat protein